MMSSLLFLAQYQKDPYLACITGTSSHPRYRDCENCEHVTDKTCEYGVGRKNLKDLRAAIADGEAMLASYPKMNPARLP